MYDNYSILFYLQDHKLFMRRPRTSSPSFWRDHEVPGSAAWSTPSVLRQVPTCLILPPPTSRASTPASLVLLCWCTWSWRWADSCSHLWSWSVMRKGPSSRRSPRLTRWDWWNVIIAVSENTLVDLRNVV